MLPPDPVGHLRLPWTITGWRMPFYQARAKERMSQGGKHKEGVEKIPPLEKAKSRDAAGAAAGVNAARLMPFYQEKATKRMEQGRPKKGEEKIPQVTRSPQSRDEAGAAAGATCGPRPSRRPPVVHVHVHGPTGE
jgi:hypothetical protein